MARIVFRVDASPKIGFGHFMRCLAIVDQLSMEQISFVVRESNEVIQDILKTYPHVALMELGDHSSAFNEAAYIAEEILSSSDIVVLDGYDFDLEYQSKLRVSGATVVVIDDLADRSYDADYIINHCGEFPIKEYQSPSYTRLVTGPKYRMLRQEFFQPTIATTSNAIKKVFVNFGGTDFNNLTSKFLPVFKQLDVDEVNIVLGKLNPKYEEVRREIESDEHGTLRLHTGLSAEQMTNLINTSDLCFVSASTIAYEVCSLGNGLIFGTYVDNQKYISTFLANSTCGVNVGNFSTLTPSQLQEAIKQYSTETRAVHIKNQREKFTSTSQLGHLFNQIQMDSRIEMRKATQDDLLQYYEWVNEPTVRHNSIQQSTIALEDHTKWFLKKIEDENAQLFIATYQGTKIGQIRFDKVDGRVEIDYSIDIKARGKGFGALILRKGISSYSSMAKEENTIRGVILSENKASIKCFEKNNFNFVKEIEENGRSFSIFEKHV